MKGELQCLSRDDHRHVTAAIGYVELGMFLDADAELEAVNPEVRHLPQVLEVRVEIYRALEKWELMETVVRRLVEHFPKSVLWITRYAFATRRAVSIEAAKAILLIAVDDQPKEALFHYNLACYECQLGDLDAAKDWLKTAFEIEPRSRSTALDDEDLAPLWESIATSGAR